MAFERDGRSRRPGIRLLGELAVAVMNDASPRPGLRMRPGKGVGGVLVDVVSARTVGARERLHASTE